MAQRHYMTNMNVKDIKQAYWLGACLNRNLFLYHFGYPFIMKQITTILALLLLTVVVSPSWSETLTMGDLVERNGLKDGDW